MVNKPQGITNGTKPTKPELPSLFKEGSPSLPIKLLITILGLSFLILGLAFQRLPPVVPLYYSLPWGDEQLVRKSQLFLIPFSIMVFFFLGIILQKTLFKKDRFLIEVLFWGILSVAVLGFITLTKIVLLIY